MRRNRSPYIYVAVYKCRLCGMRTMINYELSENEAKLAITYLAEGDAVETNVKPALICCHSNGEMGIADFQGFEKRDNIIAYG